jgi:uncharacterized SAM-binding protein YcdF (DUF218 family)
MRRIALLGTAILPLAGILLLAGVAVEIAIESGRDDARPADAIAVLGAAEYAGKPSPVLKARLDHGRDLFERRLAPRIIVTGGAGVNARFTEAEAGRDYLVQHGVPPEAIWLESEGTSTLQTIAAVAEILKRENLHSCILVSDGYHLFRARRMLARLGLDAYGSPRHTGPNDPVRQSWLYLRQSAGYWLWVLNLAR